MSSLSDLLVFHLLVQASHSGCSRSVPQPVTGPAPATFEGGVHLGRLQARISSVVGMALGAERFARASAHQASVIVLGAGNRLQMVGIHAPAIAAQMVQFETSGDRTVRLLVHDTVTPPLTPLGVAVPGNPPITGIADAGPDELLHDVRPMP